LTWLDKGLYHAAVDMSIHFCQRPLAALMQKFLKCTYASSTKLTRNSAIVEGSARRAACTTPVVLYINPIWKRLAIGKWPSKACTRGHRKCIKYSRGVPEVVRYTRYITTPAPLETRASLGPEGTAAVDRLQEACNEVLQGWSTCCCTAAASTPHTYIKFLFMPSIKRYWLLCSTNLLPGDSKKAMTHSFLNNSVKNEPISAISGMQNPQKRNVKWL